MTEPCHLLDWPGRNREQDHDDDRGSATMWVLAVGLVLISFAMVAVAYGTAVAARHRARTAADAAALAGAALVVEGDDAACTRAQGIAGANGAVLVRCHVDGDDLVVTAEIDLTIEDLNIHGAPVRATSRAGPA